MVDRQQHYILNGSVCCGWCDRCSELDTDTGVYTQYCKMLRANLLYITTVTLSLQKPILYINRLLVP
jgi:hypothetical protein